MVKVMMRRMKEKVAKYYKDLSDISNIEIIIRDGFNVDLDRDIKDKLSQKFFSRFTWYLTLFLIYAIEGVGSFIYWSDADMNQVVGNFFIGFGLPRFVAMIAKPIGCTCMSLPFLIISIKILKKDRHLIMLMEPLKIITGYSNSELKQKTIDQIRKDLRPAIFLVRLHAKSLSQVTGAMGALSTFYAISPDYVTTWKLLPVIFWTIIFSLVYRQMFRCLMACFVTLIAIKKLVIASMEEEKTTTLEESIVHQMGILKQIRYYSKTLNPVCGLLMATLFVDAIILIYINISPESHIALSLACGTVFPVYLALYTQYVSIFAQISTAVKKKVNYLFKLSDQTPISAKSRYRTSYILRGMEHRNSFSFFDIIPDVSNALTLWVS